MTLNLSGQVHAVGGGVRWSLLVGQVRFFHEAVT